MSRPHFQNWELQAEKMPAHINEETRGEVHVRLLQSNKVASDLMISDILIFVL